MQVNKIAKQDKLLLLSLLLLLLLMLVLLLLLLLLWSMLSQRLHLQVKKIVGKIFMQMLMPNCTSLCF